MKLLKLFPPFMLGAVVSANQHLLLYDRQDLSEESGSTSFPDTNIETAIIYTTVNPGALLTSIDGTSFSISVPWTATMLATISETISTVVFETTISIWESFATNIVPNVWSMGTKEVSPSGRESKSVMSNEPTRAVETLSEELSAESTSFMSTNSFVIQPTANPTYCEAVRGPLTPEEEVQLAVLFGDGQGGTAFADYVVSYASQLVAQISDVANIAVGDNDFAFTTAFDTIDIPGILGLASAAPIYTCFLSSLWAEALSNPQQYAKRAVPSQDDKIKLIVLFEKRATDGMQFDYAELLVDDTNNLIAEVQSVAGAACAAAVGEDLGAYTSLFANVDVAQFLSIATEAPIYTERLSAAFDNALESYSQSVNRPSSVILTTDTYTTVTTIITDIVRKIVTTPVTLFSTSVVTSVGSVTRSKETYTNHTMGTMRGVTSEVTSKIVRETTLPNGQVTRVTEATLTGASDSNNTAKIHLKNNGFKRTPSLHISLFSVFMLLLL